MPFDPDLIIIAGTAVTLGLGVPIVRAVVRRMERQPPREGIAASSEVITRLATIEQAVESIAVEVERISENQRFTTRLLAGRDASALPGPAIPDRSP